MNELERYADVFSGIEPWSGVVPPGYLVDFLGALTDARFRAWSGLDPAIVGGKHVRTRLPVIEDGEEWFEAVNWVEAAREARRRFVMVTLGACYGVQAVGSCLALRRLNPMPFRLVAIEPVPENYEWTMRYMKDNGIDPAAQWLVNAAICDSNAPILFPVGSPGTGAQNCFATNHPSAREFYASEIVKSGRTDEALHNLLIHNTTGLTKDLVPGQDFKAEIKIVSAVTLRDIVSPFDFIDYLESDIQQSEILVFPPFMDVLKRKMRRIHVGTHGRDVHETLHRLFEQNGWDIVFSFEPNSAFSTPLGKFTTNDGVLTVRNPALSNPTFWQKSAARFRRLAGIRQGS
jgi:hypothetical protein